MRYPRGKPALHEKLTIDTHLTHRIDDVVTLCVRDALTRKALQQQSQTHRRKPQGRNKTQCVKTSLLTLQNPHTHTNTYARTLTNQHGSHWQRRRNDATELAHADMTALPKTDTNYTALSLMPTITGNTFAASLRTDICPQRKESSSTSHARNPFNLNFFLIRLSV
jgi:hypothetical protein